MEAIMVIREKTLSFKVSKDMLVEEGFQDSGNGKCQSNRTTVIGVRKSVTLLRDGMYQYMLPRRRKSLHY